MRGVPAVIEHGDAGAVLAGLRTGERSALARAQHQQALAFGCEPGHPRRSSAHVEHGEGHCLLEILWQPRPQPASEQDGAPAHVGALGMRMDRLDLLEHQRRQGERNQRGDPVAALELAAGRVLRPDFRHAADQHPARSGDRVLHLPPGRDDLADALGDPRHVALGLFLQLPERGGVDVQALDVDCELVGPEREVGIDHLRLLRQHTLGTHYPPEPVRITHASLRWERAAAEAAAGRRRPGQA